MLLVVAIVLFAFSLLVFLFVLKAKSASELSPDLSIQPLKRYQKQPALMTHAERSFFGVLDMAVPSHLQIFSKVRIADVLKPHHELEKKEWASAFNQIKAKHFDFVLCDKNDLSIQYCIELNDSSHKRASRQKRDAFVREICEEAKVTLLEFPAQRTYQVEEIKKRFSVAS